MTSFGFPIAVFESENEPVSSSMSHFEANEDEEEMERCRDSYRD